MTVKFIPAHVVGRKFEVFQDPKETLESSYLDIGKYIRISTKKDSQLTSIDNQKKQLEQWAEVNHYNIIETYVDMRSGEYTYTREEINRLFEDIRTGKIKGVVTKEISRTSRDIMDILELKRKISAYGGFLITVKEGYDSRYDDDEFFLILHGALAQKERKTTANRVKITQIIKAKEGKTNVPQPAYGYKLSEDSQYLVINPETAPIYRLIVQRFKEGWGQLKIAKYLNQQGIPSKRGTKWCTNAIKTILSNPVYLGVTIYNTTTLIRDANGKQKRVIRPIEDWILRENTHEPLLTQHEFEHIQEIINERKQKKTKQWTCDRKYLGSSILRCAECGGKIYGARYSKRKNANQLEGQDIFRYYCSGVKGNCSTPLKRWDMKEADFVIMELFRNIFSDREKLIEKIKGEFNDWEYKDDSDEIREQLNNKIEQIDKAVRKQQMAYEQDVITLGEYKLRINELRQEKHRCNNSLNHINKRLGQSDNISKIEMIFTRIEKKLDQIHDLSLQEKIQLITPVFEAIYINRDFSIADVEFKFY